MLNKYASQGSNDDYKHLIQVNARKFNLFALHEIFLCKQEKFILLDSFVFWVSWQEKAFDPSLSEMAFFRMIGD